MKIFMSFTEKNFNGLEDEWCPQILGSYELYHTCMCGHTWCPSKIYM